MFFLYTCNMTPCTQHYSPPSEMMLTPCVVFRVCVCVCVRSHSVHNTCVYVCKYCMYDYMYVYMFMCICVCLCCVGRVYLSAIECACRIACVICDARCSCFVHMRMLSSIHVCVRQYAWLLTGVREYVHSVCVCVFGCMRYTSLFDGDDIPPPFFALQYEHSYVH